MDQCKIIQDKSSNRHLSVVRCDSKNNIKFVNCVSFGIPIELNFDDRLDFDDLIIFKEVRKDFFELFCVKELIYAKRGIDCTPIKKIDIFKTEEGEVFEEGIQNFFRDYPYSTLYVTEKYEVVMAIDNVMYAPCNNLLTQYFLDSNILTPVSEIREGDYTMISKSDFKLYYGNHENILNHNTKSPWHTCKTCLLLTKKRSNRNLCHVPTKML